MAAMLWSFTQSRHPTYKTDQGLTTGAAGIIPPMALVSGVRFRLLYDYGFPVNTKGGIAVQNGMHSVVETPVYSPMPSRLGWVLPKGRPLSFASRTTLKRAT